MVGAGLAGAAAAFGLAQRGWQVHVVDAADGPAQGASALPIGLVVPHVSVDDAVLSRLSREGARATLTRAADLLGPADWCASGVLEHRLQGKAVRTQGNTVLATSTQLAQAGLPPDTPALWHANGAWVRPARLVQAQLAHPLVQCHWGFRATHLTRSATQWQLACAHGRRLQADVVVVCAAFATAELLHQYPPTPHTLWPLHALRGQVTWGYEDELPGPVLDLLPPFPVNGLGSWVRGAHPDSGRAMWMVGSTFVREDTTTDIRDNEHHDNLAKLAQLLPSLGNALQHTTAPLHGWAAVRCTVPDRLPLVGALGDPAHRGLMVVTGLGARGLTLSVICGEVLAAQLMQEPWPLGEPGLVRQLLATRLGSRQR